MKKINIPIIAVLLAVLSVSCSSKSDTGSAVSTGDTTVYPVKTMILEKQDVARTIDYTANLAAFEEVNYAPATPGRVEEIFVEVGSHVKKGDKIARMDRTQLNQTLEQWESVRTNFERMDTLYKLNSISKQQYEAAKTQYEVTKSSVDFLTKNTTLLSPIDGIVTGKYFQSGEMYSGAPNTSAGKAAIVTLMQINPLKALINISERYYPLVKKGMKAAVSIDIYPQNKYEGEIYKVYPTISSDTRTFPVELMIRNANEVLRPGMYARVSFDMGATAALVLPAVAVIKQEGTNDRYVFKVNADNTASKIKVEIGNRFDDKIEVISEAISAGDQIIIAGQEKLLDGSRISIVE